MKLFIILSFLAIVSGNINVIIKEHMLNYNETFKLDENDEKYENFLENYYNLDNYEKYNYFNVSYKLNEFAFMSDEEFNVKYLMKNVDVKKKNLRSNHHKVYHNSNNENLPIKVDWRLLGILSRVKKQEDFKSSFSLFVSEMIETIHYYISGDENELSVQELNDCVRDDTIDDYFEYVMSNGLSLYHNYEDENHKGICRKYHEPYIFISDYHVIPENNEEELMYMVSQHPVLVMIDASTPFFRFYDGGILRYKQFPDCGKETLNHLVMLVGYGYENGVDYWILKNSWGENWGENGYFRLERGINNDGGVCGILKKGYYPIIH